MTRKPTPQVMILCEDKTHLDFLKGFLYSGRWSRRSVILQDVCPPGSQSAEGWVQRRYRQALTTLRSRHGQGRNVVLLVMIDGDHLDVSERKEQLNSDLTRRQGDPVAILVPKRNIESWFAFLDGQFESESANYKRNYGKGTPNAKYGRKLRETCSSGNPQSAPPSLQDACSEWNALNID